MDDEDVAAVEVGQNPSAAAARPPPAARRVSARTAGRELAVRLATSARAAVTSRFDGSIFGLMPRSSR